MNHGSLFSGIGGFDLAAEWMGWENVFHCEWNPFGQKVLKHYWPNAISYNDITKTDFTIHRGAIDILTGGFPCQPYSSAGKRLGKEDERHLWPSMLRAIREIQPRWIVGENVLGLVNWNGGMVFEEVQADLEAEGYEVQPYVLPAAAVGAPHRRDRVWFVAYSTSARAGENFGGLRSVFDRCNTREENATSITNPSSDGFNNKHTTTNNRIGQDNIESGTQRERTIKGLSNEWYASNSSEQRLERRKWRTSKRTRFTFNIANWHNFPSVSPICSRNDGFSNRLDGITFSKWRNESIKAGGNAIVPQVVYQIFKAIELYGIQNTSQHKGTL
jgi:DNA (cytosine-5)-methyltransferase 1